MNSVAYYRSRHVMVASRPQWASLVLGDMEAVLGSGGVQVHRCDSTPAAVRHVEQGGVDGAVLFTDRWYIDGLSLLRIIREIDRSLPCWLVSENVSRRVLQAAFDLEARGVLAAPVEAVCLLRELDRTLGGSVAGKS